MKFGAIILAGGQSRRFGKDKAWVDLNGRSLLQTVVTNLEFLGTEIIIVKAPGKELPPVSAEVEVTIVDDLIPGKGPVMGILTGLERSSYHYNLVTACDMPFLNRNLTHYMIEQSASYDAAVPVRGGRTEPLLAVYSKNCICEFQAMFDEGIGRIEPLFERVRTKFIDPAELETYDYEYSSFVNINTIYDFDKTNKLIDLSETEGALKS
ncbi:MAG: molybdenum cofactor guanylyltransferase [Dehalococcoidales bacterium]|nr:molybdenum cofactor guanylyltransferase [Dehalococcoidales bacterium]